MKPVLECAGYMDNRNASEAEIRRCVASFLPDERIGLLVGLCCVQEGLRAKTRCC